MSTLVTGGTGFVGSHLVEKLAERGETITCLLHRGNGHKYRIADDSVTYVKGDIRDREFVYDLVEGHDEVYHVAALQNYLDPTIEEFMAVNAHGTENVMAAGLEHGVEKVVYTSSQVTIDEHTGERIDEQFRHRDFFNTGYSLTKYKGEKIAFEYGARGLDVSTVHPTLIYGPRETHNLLGLVQSYVEPPIRFKGFVDTLFNFVYVDDVVQGHLGAMNEGEPGERYLLGGAEHSIGDFLDLVDDLTDTYKPSITVPKPLVRLAAYRINPLLERLGVSLPISKGQVYAMEFDSKVDNSKAKEHLGFEVTPFEDGLEETIQWYYQEGHLSTDRNTVTPRDTPENSSKTRR